MRLPLPLCLLLLLTPGIAAQNTPLFFSMNGVEVAASGAGGNVNAPGNEAAIFRDEAILAVTPGTATGNAHALCGRTTWAAFFGDDDSDGAYSEGVIGHVDAIQLRSGAANPPSLFDFWVSFSDNAVGPGGVLSGNTTLHNGDVFRLLPGGGVEHFITEAQLAQAMDTGDNFDVDAFAIDFATGDLYFSLTATETVNGASFEDGGLLRLPASGYTAGPGGVVTSVTTGAVEIALHEVHVNILFAAAGEGSVGDLRDVCIAPGGGSFSGFGGTQLPHLWFCGDTASSGAVVVSSEGGGSIAQLNGSTLVGGAAFGLGSTDYHGFLNSNLTGLTLGDSALATAPRFLTTEDHSIATPTSIAIDASGCTPGATLVLFANAATGSPAGSFTPRTSLLAPHPFSAVGGFRELYVDDFQDPLFQLGFLLPPLTVDANGYARISFALPALPAGLGFSLQAFDLPAQTLTTPVVVVTE